jgi:hypothetical protein
MNAIIKARTICSYFPTATAASATQITAVRYHERLGGLLKYHSRAA